MRDSEEEPHGADEGDNEWIVGPVACVESSKRADHQPDVEMLGVAECVRQRSVDADQRDPGVRMCELEVDVRLQGMVCVEEVGWQWCLAFARRVAERGGDVEDGARTADFEGVERLQVVCNEEEEFVVDFGFQLMV